MKKFVAGTLAAALAAFTIFAVPAHADLRDDARTMVKEKSDAIVTIEVVQNIKSSYMGEMNEEESRNEALAVIVDETGLAVTSLSSVDQSALYRRVMGENSEYDVTAQVKSLKYILANNEEVPATVVLRDPDLDLAVLRPLEQPDGDWTYISLEGGEEAELLDEIFAIGRMGKIARRQASGATGEIQGMVERPRRFYIPSFGQGTVDLGMPVFNEGGSILGILLYYSLPGAGQSNQNDQSVIAVVIPAEDVLEIAKQAPKEAPVEEVVEEAVEVVEEGMAEVEEAVEEAAEEMDESMDE